MRSTPVGFRCPECAPKQKAALAEDLLVTKGIIAANIIVFVIGLVLQNAGGFQINGVSAGNDLVANGALATDLVAQGEWWRLFTSGFLHAGLLHVGLNMFFVWSLAGSWSLRWAVCALACSTSWASSAARSARWRCRRPTCTPWVPRARRLRCWAPHW